MLHWLLCLNIFYSLGVAIWGVQLLKSGPKSWCFIDVLIVNQLQRPNDCTCFRRVVGHHFTVTFWKHLLIINQKKTCVFTCLGFVFVYFAWMFVHQMHRNNRQNNNKRPTYPPIQRADAESLGFILGPTNNKPTNERAFICRWVLFLYFLGEIGVVCNFRIHLFNTTKKTCVSLWLGVIFVHSGWMLDGQM